VQMSRLTPGFGVILLGNLTLPHTAFAVAGSYLNELRPVFAIAAGTVNPAGLSRQATWPNAPWLLGEVFCCQGVMWTTNGGLRTPPGIWASM
ncbi:MAG: hypothetical protein GY778_26750, partial [bacterium]|nr:hypothetical protein [bacterium]